MVVHVTYAFIDAKNNHNLYVICESIPAKGVSRIPINSETESFSGLNHFRNSLFSISAFKCTYCDRTFTQYNVKHERTHLEFWKSLQTARDSTDVYECFQCKKSFDQLCDVYQHLQEHSITKPRPHKCSFCGCSYSTAKKLLHHKRKHTNLIFDCEQCESAFEKESELKKHILDSHTSRIYECKQCPENFPTKMLLGVHSAIHNKTREHACVECGKVFRNINHLTQHVQSHSSDRSFACTLCPKTFKFKSSLNSHFLVHNDEQNFTCDICGKSFRYTASLKAHKCELNWKEISRKQNY